MKKSLLTLIIILFVSISLLNVVTDLQAGENSSEIIKKAMRDELERNIDQVKLKDLEEAFFISYTIRDVHSHVIKSGLGSLITSKSDHHRKLAVRVLIGDFQRTNENFFDMSSSFFRGSFFGENALPLEDDYQALRRALWIETDQVYKRVSESYERKKAALKQQSLSEEVRSLKDFSPAPQVKYGETSRTFLIDKAHWDQVAKKISRIFASYPEIFHSEVRIAFHQGDEYFINSEGTETIQPLSLASIQVNAVTQAIDGERLLDHVLHYALTPEELPPVTDIIKSVSEMAQELTQRRTAPVFDESYTGPVLFEDQAAAEMMMQRLFHPSSGLLAFRKPLLNDQRSLAFFNKKFGETLDKKRNRRILSKDLTVKAKPSLKEYDDIKLIGHYNIDAEGVEPPSEITLIENGILKTFLNDRIPTISVQASNGHLRPIIGAYNHLSQIGPSVISVVSNNGLSRKKMIKKLQQLAQDEGLDYALIVRKLKSPVTCYDPDPTSSMFFFGSDSSDSSMVSQPLAVYRLSLHDDQEILLRSVNISDISISALRHLAGVSKEHLVYNTLVPAGGGAFNMGGGSHCLGIPASCIIPRSILFAELDVKKEERMYTPKLPAVTSPLSK
ncbi:metallopeptidase TldD-related protein [candidate division CSSED10-310 bacterium]|uniref:Metallopeptidase TldD-related protein n=1 Tax=candidate division CSSED10-310 bacterium TaxID=2855610 RepID=A0ABV6Z3Q2_UNCC1